MRRTSIAFRVGVIVGLLLVALAIISFIGIRQMDANADRLNTATRLFEQLEAASGANRAFGDLRYWLTDVAVSMLTLSERNAEQARAELDRYLADLGATESELAAEIGSEADAYMATALQAVDAYAGNNRVIGNTLLAQARGHSNAVQDRLADLRARLHDQAWAARDRAVGGAQQASRVAIAVVVVVAVLGVLLALTLFRSIVTPLREINRAMTAMIGGRHDVVIPPLGDDEVGHMAQTLGLLRASNRERERLRAESEAQRRTIETAIETISEGFVLFDSDDRLVIANSNYRGLYPGLADLIVPGKSFREILVAAVESGAAQTDGLAAGEWIDRRMQQHLDPDGSAVERELPGRRWVRISEKRAPAGGIVGIYSDITDLKRRQAELEEAKREADGANQAKSNFLANMSHELRTPLNAIIGYSEMLIEEATELGHSDIVTDLDKIRIAGKHLLGLINDILDFSKIEAGKMELLVETVDIGELLSDVETTIAPLVAKNNNTLTIRAGSDLGAMQSDQTKIRQSLFNLLSNACKFTKDGVIELSVDRLGGAQGNLIRFTVADTGIGMSDEQVERLFQAFMQADAATGRNYGGTGLGLAITRHFCRMLGGDISVESEVGKGSTFSFTIPADLPLPEKFDIAVETAPGIGEATVLVIDDEKPARDMIGKALADHRYKVVAAQGGRDGLRLARKHHPDAIVLDVIMPDLDGWAVLRSLKSDPDLADIPVVLVSVLGDHDLGLALGAADYLTKPIAPDELTRVLARVRRSTETADVLVVDDDEGTRDVLRRTLVREGWAVREAVNGAQGLAELEAAKPAVVLLDLMMPEMDGFEMLRAMRERNNWHDVPVVIITSKDLSREEVEWLRYNAMNVFQKGAYGLADLVTSVRGMVEAARRGQVVAGRS